VAIRQDITADDGVFTATDMPLVFTVIDEDTGAAKDITGWTLSFKLAATQTGAAIVTSTPALTTPASGICTVTLTAANLTQTAGVYWYAMTRTDTAQVRTIVYGTFMLQGRPS
jgi:hypothetical protein